MWNKIKYEIKYFWRKLRELSLKDKMILVLSTLISFGVGFLFVTQPQLISKYLELGYAGIFIANFFNGVAIIAIFPAAFTSFLATKSLNIYSIILVSAVAISLGECVEYLLGRSLKQAISHYNWHRQMSEWFHKAPFLFLIVWTAIPNPVQSLGQIYAGSVHYPLWKYLLALIIGNIFWYIAVAGTGIWYFGPH